MGLTGSISELHRRSVAKGASFVANLWLSVAIFLMVLNLFLVLTLRQVAPQLKIISQPVFSDALTSSQTVISEPFDVDMMDKNKINEMLIRYYLSNRYGVVPDFSEMYRRWAAGGVLDRLSPDSVYKPFARENVGQLEQISKLGTTSSINITKMSHLDNTWTIELEVFTRENASGRVMRQLYDVVLEVRTHPRNAFFNSDFINPYGLQIVDFRQTQKKQ